MLDLAAESLAEDVRGAVPVGEPPIDPLRIASEEGLLLGPSAAFGPEFHGRLEYHAGDRRFLLFYPVDSDGMLSPRSRFSVCHELGHYYIDAHRELLMRAGPHNSLSGFVCDNQIEREADAFAAALLIPKENLDRRLRKRGFLDLSGVLNLARDFQTSVQCAAVRYAQLTEEACYVIVARAGRILYQTPSDEARAWRVGRVLRSPEAAAVRSLENHEPLSVLEKRGWSSDWFSGLDRGFPVFEESVRLGQGSYTLTLLSWETRYR